MNEEVYSLGELHGVLGGQFIEYVCNLSSVELLEKLNNDGDGVVSTEKETALQLLQVHVSRVYSRDQTPNSNKSNIVHYLTGYDPQLGDTIANAIRKLAGGLPSSIQRRNNLEKALIVLTHAAYPSFLLPITQNIPDRDLGFGLSQVDSVNLFRHPVNEDIYKLLTRDRALAILYPNLKSNGTGGRAYYLNNGMGTGGNSPSMFAESLIKQAYYRCLIKNTLDLDEIISEVMSCLKELKKLVEGKAVDVPMVCALSGLKLQAGQLITTPWGSIRPARDMERIWLKSPVMRQDVDVVFETTYVLKMSIVDNLGGSYPYEGDESPKNVEDNLAIITSLPPIALGKAFPIRSLGNKVIPPYQNGDSMTWANAMTFYPQNEINDNEILEVENLGRVIAETDYKSVLISFRRLASAINRTDITDGFIDLVIVWENLFGSDSSEVTFRICLAISKLLHKDERERFAKFEILKGLYDSRSKIVHGSVHFSPQEIADFWNQGLEITLETLSEIFKNRPELLDMKAATRAKQLAIKD